MELIKLYIEEDLKDNSGMDDLSTVDAPAIEQPYFAFSKKPKPITIVCGSQKGNFTPVTGDKQILAGALMIPDMEIYRNDDGVEYNVVFSSDEIAKIQKKFKMNGFNTNINQMHDPNKRIQNSVLFQDFIINRQMGIMPPLGQDHLPDGTWFGFVYIGDKEVWEKFMKTGIYTGFSIGGRFYEEPVITDQEADFIASQIGVI